MIRAVIGFSARHRLLVVGVAAALAALAWRLAKGIGLDALPDLSDTQVIVHTRWDRAADLVEQQITYPIVTGLLGLPKVKAVRGSSEFGSSFVYAVFEEGVAEDWARTQVLARLARIEPRLPPGVRPELGPDASGVGWVYQYVLVDRNGGSSLDSLRALQDWTIRYALQSVPGVAEVATVGGMPREIHVHLDPVRLQAFGIELEPFVQAIQKANGEVGGGTLESAGAEYVVRGRGEPKSPEEFEQLVVAVRAGKPVLLRDVANVEFGPGPRRGLADLDGSGETVGGIVVMRQGENALEVIGRVRRRLAELRPALPRGVEIVPVYDRSSLIERVLETLRNELALQVGIVCLVVLFFLRHIPSAIVPLATLPISVLLAFLPLAYFGVTLNVMSLAGIAISIGVLVDGAMVEAENVHHRLSSWKKDGGPGDAAAVRLEALQEVGPPVFFSLLILAVSFLPVFALESQEGKLFRPLAFSKTLAMCCAAVLAISLDPALRSFFGRVDPYRFRPGWLAWLATKIAVGSYRPVEQDPVHRAVERVYGPACRFVLRHRRIAIGGAAAVVLLSLPVFFLLGSEFMPELDEGTILYMPTTLPGVSIAQAQRWLVAQDRVLRAFPEVERVFGKVGRAETATDPAPLSMVETTILLRPPSEWRPKPRWYSGRVPDWLLPVLRRIWPDRIGRRELLEEMDRAVRMPGVVHSWTMPIRGRVDMLSTGIRTPLGVKILGTEPGEIEAVGLRVESLLRTLPGVRSAYAERTASGWFVDVEPRPDRLARYGLAPADVHRVVRWAVGGETVSFAVDGRQRLPIRVRFSRELGDDLEELERAPVGLPTGGWVPLSEVASVRIVEAPAMLRDEGGSLAAYVYVDVEGRDVGAVVRHARRVVQERVELPPGTYLVWSGQFESMERVRRRLWTVVPATVGLIALLLWASTRSALKTAIVMLSVPFSAVGAVWLLWALGYNLSVAVWVGLIALLGLDAETGVFMLLFLDLACERARGQGRLRSLEELDQALLEGAVRRLRPKLMTVSASMAGLLPILVSTSAGADVMKRIAAPMIGGLVTSFLMELLVYPAVYKAWKLRSGLFRPVPFAAAAERIRKREASRRLDPERPGPWWVGGREDRRAVPRSGPVGTPDREADP